jgi:ferritin
MVSEPVQDAINTQINNELTAFYSYLSMSAWCERQNYLGSAKWFRNQSQEEHGHAMKLLDFLLDRNHPVKLKAIKEPKGDFTSLLDVFETAYKQEQDVSVQIEGLYEMAFKEKSFMAVAELQWFLNEQVEEEKTCREIVGRLQMIKTDPAAILDIDRELGGRFGENTGGEGSDDE